jgi:hypothetical protein
MGEAGVKLVDDLIVTDHAVHRLHLKIVGP